MKAILSILLLLLTVNLFGQQQVAHFSYWQPKPGLEIQFEKGYQQHLQWHKSNNDPWSWYGWFVISGPRSGLFVDATFNHSWKDFDNSIKPTEDGNDNDLHTFPFGNFIGSSKMIYEQDLSNVDSHTLSSRFLRMITIDVTDLKMAKTVFAKLKLTWTAKNISDFMVFRMADGGNLDQFIILIGHENFEAFSKSENFREELLSSEQVLKAKTIGKVQSETMVFRNDLSLIKKQDL